KNYAKIARLLHELTGGKKGSKTSFTWGKEQSDTFHQMKEAITSAPVLILPNLEKPFRIKVDALKRAIESVLTQQDKEGRWHPTAYRLRTLLSAEKNYDTHDRELLSIVDTLKEW